MSMQYIDSQEHWEDSVNADYDKRERCNDFEAKLRQYPLTYQECFPVMAEAMFNIPKLMEAYEYFTHYRTKPIYADTFFNYLCRLEKDVALNQQRTQPDSI